MSNELQDCGDRIIAALEYLLNEPDPIRSIPLAEFQLRRALVSLRAGQEAQGRQVVAYVESLMEQLP